MSRAGATARHPVADAHPSTAFAVLCTVTAAALAGAVSHASASGPALAESLGRALRGIQPDVILRAVHGLASFAWALLGLWTGYVWLHRIRFRCRLYETELVLRSGALIVTDVTVPLENIRKLEVRRSPAGYLFGYGDLLIDDGSTRPAIVWHLRHPDRLVASIRSAQPPPRRG